MRFIEDQAANTTWKGGVWRYRPEKPVVVVTKKVFVGALVNNASLGATLRNSVGVPDSSAMPGKVERVQIVSRALENKDGAEALK